MATATVQRTRLRREFGRRSSAGVAALERSDSLVGDLGATYIGDWIGDLLARRGGRALAAAEGLA